MCRERGYIMKIGTNSRPCSVHCDVGLLMCIVHFHLPNRTTHLHHLNMNVFNRGSGLRHDDSSHQCTPPRLLPFPPTTHACDLSTWCKKIPAELPLLGISSPGFDRYPCGADDRAKSKAVRSLGPRAAVVVSKGGGGPTAPHSSAAPRPAPPRQTLAHVRPDSRRHRPPRADGKSGAESKDQSGAGPGTGEGGE
ncbi:hypothetical protein NDU88_011396 [Pleurodeles waltl]|uniref:Uncharacterized protein n=1 Tax=Pleurodeles waltl TaxID=8319 RepID=A0AAV7QZ17_PLEWA|nr:hypothetical protein NDU88_011396 [Pleurodeles waltl]